MSGSRASRSSAGTTPTVESVTRFGCTREPVLVGQHPQRLHRGVVVVQRLAHAHQHDVERRPARPVSCASTRTWPAISPAVRWRARPILPVRQNAQRHRAADLRRHAERLRGRVGNVDGLDVPAVGEAQQELRRAVRRRLARRDAGRRRSATPSASRARSARPRSVIAREVGDAAAWIQWKIWRPWNAGDAQFGDGAFESRRARARSRSMRRGRVEFGESCRWNRLDSCYHSES